jgi:hypothetical protein
VLIAEAMRLAQASQRDLKSWHELWQSVPSGKSGSVHTQSFSGVATPKTAGQPAPESPLGSKQCFPWEAPLAAPEKSGRSILDLINLAGSQQPVRGLVSLFANSCNRSTIMTMTTNLHIYEALTEAGVKPDTARNVERALEARVSQGEDRVLSNLKDKMFTKADGEALRGEIKAELYKALNDQTLRLIGVQIAGFGLLFAALKLFH